jgi:hypothetical protein
MKKVMSKNQNAANDDVKVSPGIPDKSKTEAKDAKSIISTVGAKAIAPVEKKKKEEEELGWKTDSGRDFSKYTFNGISGLSKGKVALAICKQYAKDNSKATLATMQNALQSKVIQPRYGVIAEISLARKTTVNKKERYFFKESDIIKIGNQRGVVTTQWSLDTLTPFLKIAKELGYKITATVAK